MAKTRLPEIIARHEKDLVNEWMRLQNEALAARRDRISESQLRTNSKEFLSALTEVLSHTVSHDIEQPAWSTIREALTG